MKTSAPTPLLDIILSDQEEDRERERLSRLADQQHAKEIRRVHGPDGRTDPDLRAIWVAYAWVNDQWIFAGFRRRRKRRKPQTMTRFFAKVRRRLEINKATPVMMMDLHEARKRARNGETAWRTLPPKRQFGYRERVMPNEKPALWVTEKFKQRAKVKALRLHKKETMFIALARNSWDRRAGYLFLGPLKASMKMTAIQEAKHIAPVYNDVRVLAITELSKSLLQAMHNGKSVRAGITRIIWPEVPPTFEETWHRFLRWIEKQGIVTATRDDDVLVLLEMALRIEWAQQSNPWLSVSWMRKALHTKPLKGDRQCAPKKKSSRKRKASASHRTKRSSVKSVPPRNAKRHRPLRTKSSSRRR